jgi:hypothetical protein
MEDQNGNTNLFYRLNYYLILQNGWAFYSTNIYKLNLGTYSDTLYLSSTVSDYGFEGPTFGSTVYDYDYWDNDPSKYICCGQLPGIEGFPFVSRFDRSADFHNTGWTYECSGIQISFKNDSLVFATLDRFLIKSTDGGRNFYPVDSNAIYSLVSLSPFSEKILYVNNNYTGQLWKSEDGALSFSIVDTGASFNYQILPKIYYDKDTTHLYRAGESNDTYYISVSGNNGVATSWKRKYSSSKPLYISPDYSNSGVIFMADGKEVYRSTDFCNSFSSYQTLNSPIVGIYKKSGSDKLYAATKYDIYEITSTSVKLIKHIITAVSNKFTPVPKNFMLYQNYPNPFNPSTTITYEIPKAGLVQLKIYDILGREIATLVNENQSAGKHSILFNTQAVNNPLASGIYFYRLKFGSSVLNKKMILLK